MSQMNQNFNPERVRGVLVTSVDRRVEIVEHEDGGYGIYIHKFCQEELSFGLSQKAFDMLAGAMKEFQDSSQPEFQEFEVDETYYEGGNRV